MHSAELRLAPCALALALVVCGCTNPLTEIIVIVDSELDIPEDIDDLVITVEGASGLSKGASARLAGTGSTALPATLGLRAADGQEDGPVAILVRGRRGGEERLVSRVATRFVAGERLVLRVDLTRSCVEVICAEGGTCRNGRCVSDDVDPSDLPAFRSRPMASVRLDASVDAGPPDLSIDAGPLAVPADVVATAETLGSIAVTWSASAGAETYELEVATDAAFTTPTTTDSITGTSQGATGLAAGRRHYARVRAHAADGRVSEWSEVASDVTQIASPSQPSVSVSIPDAVRSSGACCWVEAPDYPGNWYYAQGHADASCPAGSIEYRFQAQYTGGSPVRGWTGWMGADAFMVGPTSSYGVRFWAQAHCVGPDATSEPSPTGGACRMASGAGC